MLQDELLDVKKLAELAENEPLQNRCGKKKRFLTFLEKNNVKTLKPF